MSGLVELLVEHQTAVSRWLAARTEAEMSASRDSGRFIPTDEEVALREAAGKTWSLAWCHPKLIDCEPDDPAEWRLLAPRCRTSLITRDPRVDDPGNPRRWIGDIEYRAYCGHCGWLGPTFVDENEATYSGLDHAWPGWRTMPVVDSTAGRTAAWDQAVQAAYPTEWLDAGGPVREFRGTATPLRPIGTRAHDSDDKPGGYLVHVAEAPLSKAAIVELATGQLSLL